MYPHSQLDFNPLIFLVAAIVVGGIAVSRKFSLGRLLRKSDAMADSTADSPEDSAIIAFYSAGHQVANALRSGLNGMKYSTYLMLPAADGTFVDSTAAVMALDLPFNTQAHIVGLSKQHKIDRLQFAGFLQANGLQKVELEGDFPDYFDIYAAAGQDVQVREVLNPQSMDFVVNFCRTHFWEINSSELYIVATEADKPDIDSGNDNIITECQQFAEHIKPALLPGEAGAAEVHHAVPYGEYDGPPLACPICQKTMTQTNNWLCCPDGQGILINGRDILRLRDRSLQIPSNPSKNAQHGQLTCPNCHNRMTLTNYEETGVEIDACEYCPYRWLDAGEIISLGSKV